MSETETRYFPDGFPANASRQKLANAEASDYMLDHYGIGGTSNG
ncbi:MAG: hypothetical protein ABSE20_26025 [Acetobacteraceae bacterium]|jgi:hypothetical protein